MVRMFLWFAGHMNPIHSSVYFLCCKDDKIHHITSEGDHVSGFLMSDKFIWTKRDYGSLLSLIFLPMLSSNFAFLLLQLILLDCRNGCMRCRSGQHSIAVSTFCVWYVRFCHLHPFIADRQIALYLLPQTLRWEYSKQSKACIEAGLDFLSIVLDPVKYRARRAIFKSRDRFAGTERGST